MKQFVFFLALYISIFMSAHAQQTAHKYINTKPVPFRVGAWLPSDQLILDKWMQTLIMETDADALPLFPVVEEFKNLIESDPEIYMLFHQMFNQVPNKPPYNQDPAGKPQVRDYLHMLQLINQVMTKAPEFNETGLVGFPINAILDWPMGTTSGASAFLNPKVNAQLKKILLTSTLGHPKMFSRIFHRTEFQLLYALRLESLF